MSYKRQQVRDALVASKGNATEARRRLMKAMETDERLFRELATPFMHGIVSHAIDQFAKSVGMATSYTPEPIAKPKPPEPKPEKLDPRVLDEIVGQLGKNAALVPSGEDKPVEYNPQKQATTMRALAEMYKRRRVD